MAEPALRNPPLPLVQAFIACHDIFHDQRRGTTILIGPTSHVPVPQFPANIRLSFFADFSGGHGSYQPRLVLRDAADDETWNWSAPQPFEQRNPLLPHQVTFHDVVMAVPRLGRYVLALQLNGEEVAQRGMWFGPAEAFRG
jgi:hypothetical protein